MLFSLARIRVNFRRTLDSVGQKVRRHINHKGILYRQVTIVKSDYGMTKLPASSHILPFLDVRYANTKLVSKHQSDLYHISFYFCMFIAKCTCTTFPFQRAHVLIYCYVLTEQKNTLSKVQLPNIVNFNGAAKARENYILHYAVFAW